MSGWKTCPAVERGQVESVLDHETRDLQDSVAGRKKDGYQLLVTTDQNLRHQQNLADRQLAIVVLLAASWPRIQQHVDDIRAAVDRIGPGMYIDVPI